MGLQCSAVFVALADPNGKTLVQFYQALFGQAPVSQVPDYAEFQLPGLRLGIFKPKSSHTLEFAAQTGNMSLCLEVEQLEGAIAAIEQAYLETPLTAFDHLLPGEIIAASHGREVYAYDPVGNRLILHEALKHKVLKPETLKPETLKQEAQKGKSKKKAKGK
jgi:hypothetical protein